MGILFDVVLLGSGRIRNASILEAPVLLITLLAPIGVGLCMIAGGQVLRAVAVIGRATQESASHLAQLRRSQVSGDRTQPFCFVCFRRERWAKACRSPLR